MEEGHLIGNKWRVVRLLGRGSMGRVYEVRHKQLPLRRALKQLHAELAEDPAIKKRFEEEARRGAALKHPNIVAVTDIESDAEDSPYLVMDLVEGETLGQRLQARDAFDYAAVLQIGLELASALDCAHRLGVIHRDIKPANILLESGTGRPMLTDFGIAKKLDDSTDISLTGTGLYVGTVRYSSREQLRNERGVTIDGRADIYSLGVVLYEMLSGERYLEGCSEFEIASKVGFDPDWTSELEFDALPPADFRALLERCMAPDRKNRIETATDLIEEIEACRLRSSRGETMAGPPAEQERPSGPTELEPGLAAAAPDPAVDPGPDEEPTATAFTVERLQQMRQELTQDAAEYAMLRRAMRELGCMPEDTLQVDDISRMLLQTEQSEKAGRLAASQRDLFGVRTTLLGATERAREQLTSHVGASIQELVEEWEAADVVDPEPRARHDEQLAELQKAFGQQDWPGCARLLRGARQNLESSRPGPTAIFAPDEEEQEPEVTPLAERPSRGPALAIGIPVAVVLVAAGAYFLIGRQPTPTTSRNDAPSRVESPAKQTAPAESAQEKKAAAAAAAEKAARDDARRAQYLDHLKVSEFFRDRGDYEGAIRELDRALALEPNDPKATEMRNAAVRARQAESTILGGDG